MTGSEVISQIGCNMSALINLFSFFNQIGGPAGLNFGAGVVPYSHK